MTIEELIEKLKLELNDENTDAIKAFSASEVAALKNTNKELKAEKRALAEKLDAYKDFDKAAIAEILDRENDDLDLEELPELIAALKEARPEADPKDPPKDDPRIAELERKLERVTRKADERVAEAEAKADKLTGALGKSAVTTQAAEAISTAEGSIRGLMPHVQGRIKSAVDEDGTVELTIMAPNGEPMEDDKGNPATMKHLIDELRRDEDLSGLFKAPPGGAGTKRVTQTGGTQKTYAEMNLDERSAMRISNPALLNRLKSEAA